VAFFREAKRAIRAATLPCAFLGVAVYFTNSAVQGDRGLRMAAQRQDVLLARQAELVRAEAERDNWERRVGALRSNRLDRDMLDERARAMLNLADPDDVIVQYGPKERLF
jgi:cell division protein FtsB